MIKFRCIAHVIAVLPKCSAILNKSKAKYTLSCDSARAKRVHLGSIRPQRDWPCPGHVMDSYHKLGILLSPWPAFRLQATARRHAVHDVLESKSQLHHYLLCPQTLHEHHSAYIKQRN